MVKIAVVDDDPVLLDTIHALITRYFSSRDIGFSCDRFSGGEEFLASAQHIYYHLVFLDIYMAGASGIETATLLKQSENRCAIVFLTSSKNHMPDAFAVHAFDYLVKPVEESRLFHVLEDVLLTLPETQPALNLPVGKAEVPVLYSTIRSITADSQYCLVHADETTRCRIGFRDLTARLENDERFLIINRGILVNLDFVADMNGMVCRLKSGETYPLNIRKSSVLRQALVSYRFLSRTQRMNRRDPR